MNSHAIEPELLQSVPRRVHPRGKTHLAMGCMQLFMLPHILVGIGVALWALLALFVFLFGHNVPGRITGHYTSIGEHGPSYFVRYAYSVGAAEYTGTESVSSEEFTRYEEGSTMDIRMSPLFGNLGAQPLLPGHSAFSSVLFPWMFALFWNAIVSVFVWMFYVLPRLHRRLVERGLPTTGRITDKKVTSSDHSNTYRLTYEYSPDTVTVGNSPALPSSFTRRMLVKREDYERIQIGDSITVLYALNRPGRSVVYPFSNFEVVA